MKKTILASAILCVLGFSSYAQNNTPATDNGYTAFTKTLKKRLDQDKVDLKKIQFYIDQPLTLSRASHAARGQVQNGVVVFNNAPDMNRIVIPAYTPVVCERASGDSLMISFDMPNKTICFGALYANENFIIVSPSWYNGVAEITYDNQPYQVRCAGCGSAANAKLVIKKDEQPMVENNINRTIGGRTIK
jgi:hypothetical protein